MKVLILSPLHRRKGEKIVKENLRPETGLPYYQAQNFWYEGLRRLGHDVRLFVYSGFNPELDYYSLLLRSVSEKMGLRTLPILSILPVWQRQKNLLQLARDFVPEVVILSGNTDLIFPDTLVRIKKEYKSKLVLLNGLSPVVCATQTEKVLTSLFDCIFTNDEYHAVDWKMLGAKRARALPVSAIDPAFCKPRILTTSEKLDLGCDVSFVGSLSPNSLYSERLRLLESLTQFDLKIWSPNEQEILRNPKLSRFYQGQAFAEKMQKIFCATKINLNFHGHTMQAGGNLRTFEIPGCSGFELVDRVNPRWYRIGKEIITFTSATDLKRKITYYLSHASQRKKIAVAGYQRTLKEHTYTHRFSKMLKMLTA